jgi:hypothetical protein
VGIGKNTMSQGYLFITLGQRYIDECNVLVETIRKNGDTRPISLVIHPEDKSYAESFGIYDQFVMFEPDDQLWKDCETSFEKYCLYPRLRLNNYLVYVETIITDTDVLCQYNTEHIWTYMSNQSYPIRMLGRINDPNWHWGTIQEVSQAYGRHIPHVHGGFFYIRKHPFLEEFFSYCDEVFYKYDDYKCKRFFRGGRVDEIIFAIAHSHFGIWPVPFDEYPIMAFNYTPEFEIPSRIQTEGNQNAIMNGYIPFVHMFDKMGGKNFTALYDKIIRN